MLKNKSDFNFNPFSGVLSTDIDEIIIPRFQVEEIISKVESKESLAIEFLGKKGRGKTTHLIWLNSFIENASLYLLNNNSDKNEILKDDAQVIFIDSIHHLNIMDRIRLFKTQKVIVYTTHWTRKMDCWLAGKKIETIRFKGIDTSILEKMINKRIQLAKKGEWTEKDRMEASELKRWIDLHGDDYRGIINGLYDEFQKQ